MKKNKLKIVPIVFATDDNYAPFLTVTLQSISEHASATNLYRIFVLQTSLDEHSKKLIMQYCKNNIEISFINVTDRLDKISSMLHLRDYYTNTTYYRFFIPSILKQYNKCLYLDCDIVVLDDIANLYNCSIGEQLLGVIADDVIPTDPAFSQYVQEALGINANRYFNAGILVMNLKKLRAFRIEERFINLMSQCKFRVAQDQDYLNVLCKNKVKYLSLGWNKAPILQDDFDIVSLKLVHYKMAMKPWHHNNILYGDYFWKYAIKTDSYDLFTNMLKGFSKAQSQQELASLERLKQMAICDAKDPNNYHNQTSKNKKTNLSNMLEPWESLSVSKQKS